LIPLESGSGELIRGFAVTGVEQRGRARGIVGGSGGAEGGGGSGGTSSTREGMGTSARWLAMVGSCNKEQTAEETKLDVVSSST
jgi:hypothetical protein